ncbi:MAG: hypothetical protein COZ49_03335 [Candidatus Yonathbacteria bacterium CG_4_10_14_3_um_filter_47_65]|uniref:Uncharacterized protein n=2 Tax=Parcubacteria group TaxID=1794811 RepID=A0A2M8D5X8_9BACT|nr:MAG: hypothetical protein AUJ44_02360 [Candidatus Nomurabacteria bacterium CG1_02_47_685]PIP04117.1 MAG: hypothetical protein COX54_00795 [Candidatus Yonathbacteria bacterium CG23_combo_of_CG06-09_8_20_14_all_46_18]PIQ32571.1 MAG: hypothetical protein COW61_01400 [Candidatus Yonathbacteria bacterium CG17_big_fil_post_rev_8_21_14_2_50_46_19]PIX56213.1 MAG: hypothetical protein COZ49_03335 [Candidatus Yonathbacteria bacterium CG_4_10_14_3_um_filter_47_65]PIY57752.1 MAG: hypothetical protein CO
MEKEDIGTLIKKLEEIVAWFSDQNEVNVEEGLKKVKEGAQLIAASRARMKKLENEFEEVKADLEKETL